MLKKTFEQKKHHNQSQMMLPAKISSNHFNQSIPLIQSHPIQLAKIAQHN